MNLPLSWHYRAFECHNEQVDPADGVGDRTRSNRQMDLRMYYPGFFRRMILLFRVFATSSNAAATSLSRTCA